MKKALVLGLVVLLVIGSAVAAHAKAQKADLKDINGNTVGFVIFNNPNPEDNETNCKVVVSLKKGSPTTTYQIDFYAQGPSGIPISIYRFGYLTTNPRGKGNWTSEEQWWNLRLGPEPGQWEIYVTVGAIFTSDTVTLNLTR